MTGCFSSVHIYFTVICHNKWSAFYGCLTNTVSVHDSLMTTVVEGVNKVAVAKATSVVKLT